MTFVFLTEYLMDQTIPATPYYLAGSFAKMPGCEVIFVEKAVSLIALFREGAARHRIGKFGRIRQISGNFYVYTPFPRLPFDRKFFLLSILNQLKLRIEVKKLLKSVGDRKTLVTFNYNTSMVVKYFKQCIQTVYYVLDDWKEFDFPLGAKKLVKKEHEMTMLQADHIIAVSETLAENARTFNKTVSVIKNGVDISQYENQEIKPIPEMEPFKKYIIGFVGTIEQWVDLDLIEFVAKNFDSVDIVLIGPCHVNVDKFRHLPNVHFLGPKPKEDIPFYVKAMHIGIIPFKLNKLSKSVSPLKLYEYLAVGIPVVSTPMDGVAGLDHLDVYVGETYDSFASHLRRILQDYPHHSKNREARTEFAKENCWDARTAELLSTLGAASR